MLAIMPVTDLVLWVGNWTCLYAYTYSYSLGEHVPRLARMLCKQPVKGSIPFSSMFIMCYTMPTELKELMRQAIKNHFGERCSDYVKECVLCHARHCFDYLFEEDYTEPQEYLHERIWKIFVMLINKKDKAEEDEKLQQAMEWWLENNSMSLFDNK